MASRRRCRTESAPDTSSETDLISQLPDEVKERILEHLPTRDAARTATLSSHWKDLWFRHGNLVFDSEFFKRIANRTSAVNTINAILISRSGPVKKFTLNVHPELLHQSDLDRWCLFLSRNGIEQLRLYISADSPIHSFKLPDCMVSCPTINQLQLVGFRCLVNRTCMFPESTRLDFKYVVFEKCSAPGTVVSFPKVLDLSLHHCDGRVFDFEINAPSLSSLSAIGSSGEATRWIRRPLEAVKALRVSDDLVAYDIDEVAAFPTATNLEVLYLCEFSFGCLKQLKFALLLLQKSPLLRHLEIKAIEPYRRVGGPSAALRSMEDPKCPLSSLGLNMLKTVKIKSFRGSKPEMLFIKALLAKSPSLEKVCIQEAQGIDASVSFKCPRQLLSFSRASPKAQIFYLDYTKPKYGVAPWVLCRYNN